MKGTTSGPESLLDSVNAAVGQMHWLTATDGAAVNLARHYASTIDEVLATGTATDITKALYLGPHLLNALRALGGAPNERRVLVGQEVVSGKLAALRAVNASA